MADEAELADGMTDLNLLEKRAFLGTRKEKARKELMKVRVYKLEGNVIIISEIYYLIRDLLSYQRLLSQRFHKSDHYC